MSESAESRFERPAALYKLERRKRKRRPSQRIDTISSWGGPIDIRIGNRQLRNRFQNVRVSGARDAGDFATAVHKSVRANRGDPLLIAVNGHQPWLREIFHTCINDHDSEPASTNREVQFADTVQFPQRSMKRTRWVPWSFICDHMNVPEVYWWTFGLEPPVTDKSDEVDSYRMRLGVWTCGRGAFRDDDRATVILIFTQSNPISERVVTELLFPFLYEDVEYPVPRQDEEGVCWIFLRLYELLTDWQNIQREIERRLEEAELNSRSRGIPVKLRTRSMHKEVDRIYELTEYLRFHNRSFKKLVKLKDNVKKEDQTDSVWDEMDDAVDDLDQFGYYLDSLKERFNNLIELEFNIENANQSDNSRFLSVIATLFLPISFLASIFGITTITWPPIWYLYIAIPLAVLSLAFTVLFPASVRRWQKYFYPLQKEHVRPQSRKYTMLGEELPESTAAPATIRYGSSSVPRNKGVLGLGEKESRSRSRSRSRKSRRGGR